MSELKIVKSDVKVYSININNGFQSGGVLSTLSTLRVNFFIAFLGFFGYCTLSGHLEKINFMKALRRLSCLPPHFRTFLSPPFVSLRLASPRLASPSEMPLFFHPFFFFSPHFLACFSRFSTASSPAHHLPPPPPFLLVASQSAKAGV